MSCLVLTSTVTLFHFFCLAESMLSAYSNRQLQVHWRKNNTENESVHTLYLKNSKQPNERHLASLDMSICTIHVLNFLCKKIATTMSMYINYCQKQKEHSLCFLFFFFFCLLLKWFKIRYHRTKSELHPWWSLKKRLVICKIKRLKQIVQNFSPHSD